MAGLRVDAVARLVGWVAPLLAALFLTAVLGSCASGSLGGVFSGKPDQGQMAPIAFAPIIGAPPQISNELTGQLTTAARRANIPVVTERGKPADYTVRGYLAASQDRKNNKLAYIWDVTDKAGKRVHRILGEEVTPTRAGRDAWASFDKSALEKIASKTATDLAKWLPKQTVATATQQTAAQPAARPATPAARQPAPTSTRTARVRSGAVMAYVPSVSGAPGDGRRSLTLALKKQLFSKGIKLASGSGSNVYTVRGKVTLGRVRSGQQDIKIDWQVLNPAGQRLGTVSQQNRVPKGSLDNKWGPIAEAAAGAAADGIIKLIPKR